MSDLPVTINAPVWLMSPPAMAVSTVPTVVAPKLVVVPLLVSSVVPVLPETVNAPPAVALPAPPAVSLTLRSVVSLTVTLLPAVAAIAVTTPVKSLAPPSVIEPPVDVMSDLPVTINAPV